MTTKRQAKYNGEIGVNGKSYKKGQFISEQEFYTGTGSKSRKSKVRKQEIEPYKWETPPSDGLVSIYSRISGVVYDVASGKRIYSILESGLYPEWSKENIDKLCQMYESGERWFYPDEIFCK